VAIFYARWTGWGILTLPILVLSVLGGSVGAVALLPDLASSDGEGIDRSGVPLGGAAIGVLAGGVLIYLMGLAINRDRRPDGTRVWTDRHQVNRLPVQNLGRRTTVFGVILLPLGAVGFAPAAAVWAAVLGWAGVVVAVVVLRARSRRTDAARGFQGAPR
jgi:hypothetical protein